MSEPRLIRVARPSRQTAGIFPCCERCGRLLKGQQQRYCSHYCTVISNRLQLKWARRLEAYWQA